MLQIDHMLCLFLNYRTDQLILKLVEDSDAVLMLSGLIPDYVSQNHIEGRIECEQFFPAGYRNSEEEEEEKEGEEKEDDDELDNENESGGGSENELDNADELNVVTDNDDGQKITSKNP